MTTRRIVLAGLAAAPLAAVGPARAQGQAEGEAGIKTLMEHWAALYGSSSTPEEIAALYAEDAVFWGTGSTVPFVDRASFAPYFQRQFDSFVKRQVSFHDAVIRIYGEGRFATNIGTYEFQVETAAGQVQQVRHRYSFAYIREGDGWLIVQQHSSALPR